MAGLLTLRDIYEKNGKGFINKLFNSRVLVTENLRGSRVYVQRGMYDGLDKYTLDIFKRDDRYPITKIDRLLMKYYEKAIDHFNLVQTEVIMMIPSNWRFCFQYFPNNAPVNVMYDNVPKNHLVLTAILVKNDSGKTLRVIDNPKILQEWSRYLKVQGPSVIFYGTLDDTQKKSLFDFVETDTESLKKKFGTESFVKYVISVLNPRLKKTALNDDLNKPIDSVIFKFFDNYDGTVSAKLVDPIIRSMQTNHDTSKSTSDIYSITIVDILEFLEKNPKIINKVLLSSDPDERYIELICDIFNAYVKENGKKYDDVDFQVPDFAKTKDFDLNLDFIKNEETKRLLDNSESYRTLFKIFLSTFRKRRRTQTEIITRPIITLLNKHVSDIKKITQTPMLDSGFKNFSDYLRMKKYNENLYFEDDNSEFLFENENNEDDNKLLLESKIEMNNFDQGFKKVSIMVGRFQPFTEGHVKVAKKIYDKTKSPIVIVVIRGKKSDPERRPFDVTLQKKMLQKIVDGYPFIEKYIIHEGTAAINSIWDVLRPEYEPVAWGVGQDRFAGFDRQVKDYKKDINLHPDFKLINVKRDDDSISATIVRRAILNADKITFEKLTPSVIHDMYGDFYKVLINLNEEARRLMSSILGEAFRNVKKD